MSLLEDVLAANAAVLDGSDVPVPPLAAGRRVVIVACSEIRAPAGRDLAAYLGLDPQETLVVAVAGARVGSPEGDVATSVIRSLALGDGGEVFVVAHEGCEFLETDPESAAALSGAASSAVLGAAQRLCGEDFISARKLAITTAETLRNSPFLARCPVHALVFADGRGRLTSEQRGYDAVPTAPSGLGPSMGMSAAPSPILAASGSGGPGPVNLFGSGPSPLMGAPQAFVAPPPDLGGRATAAFLAPPPVAFPTPPAPVPMPPPLAFPSAPPPEPAAPPPPPTLSFDDIPPPPLPQAKRRPQTPPGPSKAPDTDDPFRRAAETLERLRRERRK